MAEPTVEDAIATIRTKIFAQLITTMPPSTYDHLELAVDAAMDALNDPQIQWVYATIAGRSA